MLCLCKQKTRIEGRKQMKIKTTITEIECSAEELRQSNSAADAFMNVFRSAFNGAVPKDDYYDEDDEDESDI